MKWQTDDPNVQEKVGNCPTEQELVRIVTVLSFSKSARPERREMCAAFQYRLDTLMIAAYRWKLLVQDVSLCFVSVG